MGAPPFKRAAVISIRYAAKEASTAETKAKVGAEELIGLITEPDKGASMLSIMRVEV